MKALSPKAKKILQIFSQDEARKLGSPQILPEHVVLALLNTKACIAYSTIIKLNLSPEELRERLLEHFEKDFVKPTLNEIPKSRRFQFLIDIADIESSVTFDSFA